MNKQLKQDAFKELYLLCKDYCLSRLLRLTNNMHDAEDVFAEAISIYWLKLKQNKIKNSKNIPAYVFTIARNLYFTKLRSSVKTEELNAFELFNSDEMLAYKSIEKELIDKVRLCLNELNEGCRQLLIYKYVYKYTYEEMAERLKRKSSDSLKTQTHRCLKKLKEVMKSKKCD